MSTSKRKGKEDKGENEAPPPPPAFETLSEELSGVPPPGAIDAREESENLAVLAEAFFYRDINNDTGSVGEPFSSSDLLESLRRVLPLHAGLEVARLHLDGAQPVLCAFDLAYLRAHVDLVARWILGHGPEGSDTEDGSFAVGDVLDPSWEEDVRSVLRGFTVEPRFAGSEVVITCPPQFSILSLGPLRLRGENGGPDNSRGSEDNSRGSEKISRGSEEKIPSAEEVLSTGGRVMLWPAVEPGEGVPVHATEGVMAEMWAQAVRERGKKVAEVEAEIAEKAGLTDKKGGKRDKDREKDRKSAGNDTQVASPDSPRTLAEKAVPMPDQREIERSATRSGPLASIITDLPSTAEKPHSVQVGTSAESIEMVTLGRRIAEEIDSNGGPTDEEGVPISGTDRGIVEALWRLGFPAQTAPEIVRRSQEIARVSAERAADFLSDQNASVSGSSRAEKGKKDKKEKEKDRNDPKGENQGENDAENEEMERVVRAVMAEPRVTVAEIRPSREVVRAATPAVALLRKTRAHPRAPWQIVRGSLSTVAGVGPSGLPMLCVRHFALTGDARDDVTVARIGVDPRVALEKEMEARDAENKGKKGKK